MIDWPAFLSLDARIDFWTIAVAVVANAACALVGCYLVLRRMSLLGDAISHAIVAGVAFAFLVSGTIGPAAMLAGGLAVGLLTAFLTQALTSLGRTPEDSSMGVVFTSLFAVGVILLSGVNAHVDADCVLFGRLAEVSLDPVTVLGWDVPRALATLGPVLLVTAAVTVAFWKELKIASFDPMLATAMGLSASLVHYLLMGLVAAVTVASLEAVGAIVAVAMLIVPAATAHLLTDRLGWMMAGAVAVGTAAAVVGCLAARWLDTNAAGMVGVAAGAQFLAAVLAAPRHGVLGKAAARGRLALRIAAEDVIAMLYRHEEKAPGGDAALPLEACRQFAGAGLTARLAIPLLRRRGQVAVTADGRLGLTDRGRRLGRSLVRSHRLWEAYLEHHFDLPADHLHEPAERLEHYIGPELQEKLARELDRPETDPHGSRIPQTEVAARGERKTAADEADPTDDR